MKKIFVYAYYSDQILDPKGVLKANIGGAEVQLAFWSKVLAEIAKVYSFSYTLRRCLKKRSEWGVHFYFVPFIPKVNALLFYLRPIWLLFCRPDYVMMKSASQELGIILKLKKLLGFKIIYLLASDNDVEIDSNTQKKRIITAIKNADYVIAQNIYQEEKVKERYHVTNVMQLGNIWDKTIFTDKSAHKQYDYIWVSKFNRNKRPEWFVELAKSNPDKEFAMIGASLKGYEKLVEEIKEIKNLHYFGFKSLYETTELVSQSRCLACTSGYEGFPNTFLQAFSYNIPVLSTVNPSGILTKYNLGYVFETLDEANTVIREDVLSKVKSEEIAYYFKEKHNPKTLRDKMSEIIQLEK